ncbi:MAG: flagellar protein FlaG [Hydrogenothermaceae bacterium]|nr:flagellar protein FlaG [Hydrogenothermaceae bacterium]
MKIDSLNSTYIDEVIKIATSQNQPQDIQQNLKQISQQINQGADIQNQKSDVMDKNILKDPQELKKLVDELKSKLSYLNSQLKIELDNEINQPVVKIVDINTNQVIRQIPPDYIVNIIKNINKLLGVLFEKKA